MKEEKYTVQKCLFVILQFLMIIAKITGHLDVSWGVVFIPTITIGIFYLIGIVILYYVMKSVFNEETLKELNKLKENKTGSNKTN